MMGSRGIRGGGEEDYLTGFRRLIRARSKVVRYFKRKFWKRQRRQARREAVVRANEEGK